MTRLFVEPEAEEELELTALRYERAAPGLGRQYLEEMRQRIRDIAETPMRFPQFDDASDVRCAHAIGRFPHIIVFAIAGDVADLFVHVLAFMHPKQRPGYWSDRRIR
jgi:plasmid stabilization system protein ParE